MKKSQSRPKITTITNATAITTSDMIIERKIETATEGLSYNCFNFLHNKILPVNKESALVICDYISSLRVPPSEKRSLSKVLNNISHKPQLNMESGCQFIIP